MSDLEIKPAPFDRRDDCALPKRTYLPFVLYSVCPKCGKRVTVDLRSDYLSYPYVGVAEPVTFYHPTCGVEWRHDVVIDFALTEAGQ